MRHFNMSNAEIEEFCEALVLDYIRKHKAPDDYIDIRGLMTDYLGLEIEFESIVETDRSITSFIANGSRTLDIIRDGKKLTMIYPQKTIVIDKCYLAPDQRERCRFNMAHEAGHYLMNKLCNTNEAAYNRDLDMLTFIPNNKLHSVFNINEAIANKFAAAILLPRFVVKKALETFNQGKPITVYGDSVFDSHNRNVLRQMIGLLGVRLKPLYIRLCQFGVVEYRPLEELLVKQIRDAEVSS